MTEKRGAEMTGSERTEFDENLCDYCCFKEDLDGDYGCILGNKPKDDCESFELGFSEER